MNNIVERLVDAVLDCDSKEVNRLAALLRERIAAGDACAKHVYDDCADRLLAAPDCWFRHRAAVEACGE